MSGQEKEVLWGWCQCRRHQHNNRRVPLPVWHPTQAREEESLPILCDDVSLGSGIEKEVCVVRRRGVGFLAVVSLLLLLLLLLGGVVVEGGGAFQSPFLPSPATPFLLRLCQKKGRKWKRGKSALESSTKA